MRSPRRIALTFLEAELGAVKPSPLLETLLAPALLPRGWWNMQALLGLREVGWRRFGGLGRGRLGAAWPAGCSGAGGSQLGMRGLPSARCVMQSQRGMQRY